MSPATELCWLEANGCGVVCCRGGDLLLVVTHREEENLDLAKSTSKQMMMMPERRRKAWRNEERWVWVQQKKSISQLRKKAESFGVGPA
ncbi:unnamed protein product [Sphagnum balticum]